MSISGFLSNPKVLESFCTSMASCTGLPYLTLKKQLPCFINRSIKTEAVQLAVIQSRGEQGRLLSVQHIALRKGIHPDQL